MKDHHRPIRQGFSLLMYGATVWVLLSGWTAHRINRIMFMVACLFLWCSTVARIPFHLPRVSMELRSDYIAPHHRHYKNFRGFDIIWRHIPGRFYRLLIKRLAMDFCFQKLCVRYTDNSSGRRPCELIFVIMSILMPLTTLIALPLLHGMAV